MTRSGRRPAPEATRGRLRRAVEVDQGRGRRAGAGRTAAEVGLAAARAAGAGTESAVRRRQPGRGAPRPAGWGGQETVTSARPSRRRGRRRIEPQLGRWHDGGGAPEARQAQISQTAASKRGVATWVTGSAGPGRTRGRSAAHQVGEAAVRHLHPLGPAGRAGGVDDVGEVVRRPPRHRHRRVARRPPAIVVQADEQRRPRPGASRAPRRRPGVSSTGPRASSSMKARRSGGIGRIERHVGAAGLEDAEQRRPPAPAERSTQTADRQLRPDAELAQAAGQAVGARVELAVGQALARERPRRRRVRACARACARRADGRRLCPSLPRRCRSTRPAAGGARPRRAAAARRPRRSGSATAASRRRREVARAGARRCGVEEVGGVLQRAAQSAVAAPRASGSRSNFAVRPRQVDRPQAQARRSPACRHGAFWRANMTWNEGRAAEVRSGCSSSTSCSNGTSWCA